MNFVYCSIFLNFVYCSIFLNFAYCSTFLNFYQAWDQFFQNLWIQVQVRFNIFKGEQIYFTVIVLYNRQAGYDAVKRRRDCIDWFKPKAGLAQVSRKITDFKQLGLFLLVSIALVWGTLQVLCSVMYIIHITYNIFSLGNSFF